jgi:hypothetical protein
MATFKSDLMTGQVPMIFRGGAQGQPIDVTAVVKIPAGTLLTDGDFIKFLRVGQNVRVLELELSSDGDLDDGTSALRGQLGYFQALNTAGTALIVDDKTGTTYTSPADATDHFVDAADAKLVAVLSAGPASAFWHTGNTTAGNNFDNVDVDGYAGPVDIGIEITTTANSAPAAAQYLRLRARLLQKEATQGEFSGDLATAYTNRYNSSGSSQGLKS